MTPLFGPVAAPGLHVMTYNIRRPMAWSPRRADRWTHREHLLRALLAAERPHLLAAQEVFPGQARAVSAALGDGYGHVGHGRRADGSGEATPLFYDGARLELRAWTQRALSDRPDDPGSRTWGNTIPRILVEAVFRDRETGAEFLAIGTHFDVFSARARRASATAVRDRIAAQDRPAIVLGDLNAGPSSEPLRTLLAPGGLDDAWELARERRTPEWGTFGGYRTPTTRRPRIDHILLTPGVTVGAVGIHAAPTGGGWPSDHLPAQAVVRFAAGVST